MKNENMTNQSTTNTVKQFSFTNNNLSDLYIACQEGNYLFVLALLEALEVNAINRPERNGSTAFGHVEIVSLLVNVYGVIRDLKDQNNRTAYEVACNDEIRQLFHRPKMNNRFYSNDNNNSANLFSIQHVESSSNRVERYENVYEVRTKQLQEVEKQVKSPVDLFSDIFKRLFSSPKSKKALWATTLLSIIEEQLGTSHRQYRHACQLIHRYLETSKIEPLLCLYSLETPFYRYVTNGKDSSDSLAQPLFDKLGTLYSRAFQGNTYRGLSMTTTDLQVYYRAHQHEGSYLGTNTFCSTSVDKNTANFFMEAYENENKINIMMEFSFAKTCKTAIRLYEISSDLPCLSNFEDEKEVLILPGTVFRVKDIVTDGYNIRIILDHYNMEDDIHEYRFALYEHNLPDW